MSSENTLNQRDGLCRDVTKLDGLFRDVTEWDGLCGDAVKQTVSLS